MTSFSFSLAAAPEELRPTLGPTLDCLVVIVTHNSANHIQWCIDGLKSSTSRLAIRVVDSGSQDTRYLSALRTDHELRVSMHDNVGFVAANNLALEDAPPAAWILYLNPDARIEGEALDQMLAFAESPANARVGMLTVPLIKFDIYGMKETGVYDGVGIGSTWYGRWKDLLSGEPVVDSARLQQFRAPEAICGALMAVRAAALKSAPDSTGVSGFERRYYMYKEDIELSLRIRRAGWSLALMPQLFAYHCRGWDKRRSAVPFWARLESAKNDLDVARRYRWRALPFAAAKFIWVKAVERGSN